MAYSTPQQMSMQHLHLTASGAARALVTGLKLVMEWLLVEWAPSKKIELVFFARFTFEGPYWALLSLGWALRGLNLALVYPTWALQNCLFLFSEF